jgi:fructokinase
MEDKQYVMGIGELLWDVFPDGKQIGGAPVNFAYHVKHFGLDSIAISAVDKDDLGAEIINTLNGFHLNFNAQEVNLPTGTVQVSLTEDGIPQYEIKQPVAWDSIFMKPSFRELSQKTSAICFGSLAQRDKRSRETIREIVSLVPDKALKIFDINLRQAFFSKELIDESMKISNILKINDDELVKLMELFGYEGSIDDIVTKIINTYNLRMVVLTCGIKGSYLFTSTGEQSFIETPKVAVADTVGAGDSFTAAIVAGLLKGKSIKEIHRIAVKLSAFVCTQKGAMPIYSYDMISDIECM